MAKLDRRQRERAEFREEVLAAARKIVLEEGFEALTMRKIADAIEYAPGTIYLYFESRDAIAFELCRVGFEDFLAAMAPAVKHEDPVDRFRDLGRRYIRFGLDNPETYRMLFMDQPKYLSDAFHKRAEEPDSPGMQALGLLVSIFVELREQKRLKSDAAPQALAETIWAAVHGIVSLKVTHNHFPETSAAELLDCMVAALIDGVVDTPS